MGTPEQTCESIQRTIDEMSRSELHEAGHQGPVHEHTQRCPTCCAYLEEAWVLDSRLDQWEVPLAKRNIAASVMAEIAQLERQRASRDLGGWGRVIALLRVRLQVPAAAMILLLVVLTVSVILNVSRGGRLSSPRYVVQPPPTQSVSPAKAQEVDLPVGPVKVTYVATQNSQVMRSFLARPELSPSTVIIILGVPPILPLEAERKPMNAVLRNHPL